MTSLVTKKAGARGFVMAQERRGMGAVWGLGVIWGAISGFCGSNVVIACCVIHNHIMRVDPIYSIMEDVDIFNLKIKIRVKYIIAP